MVRSHFVVSLTVAVVRVRVSASRRSRRRAAPPLPEAGIWETPSVERHSHAQHQSSPSAKRECILGLTGVSMAYNAVPAVFPRVEGGPVPC